MESIPHGRYLQNSANGKFVASVCRSIRMEFTRIVIPKTVNFDAEGFTTVVLSEEVTPAQRRKADSPRHVCQRPRSKRQEKKSGITRSGSGKQQRFSSMSVIWNARLRSGGSSKDPCKASGSGISFRIGLGNLY